MSEIQGLQAIVSGYLHEEALPPLIKAYEFVCERHKDAVHDSGESYDRHLVEVATTLATMKLDLDTILAGLLHGDIEGKRCHPRRSCGNFSVMKLLQ